MRRPPVVNPDAFDVTCRCGAVIHTDRSHVGRTIRCRCGTAVTIEAPATPPPSTGSARGSQSAPREARRPRAASPHAAARTLTLRRALHRVRDRLVAMVAAPWRGLIRALGSSRTSQRWLAFAGVAYLVVMGFGWWLFGAVNESWLPATLLLYGPRAVVLLPGLLLLVVQLIWARRALAPTALGLLIGLFGFMGFELSAVSHPLTPPPLGPTAERGLRVVSLNAEGGDVVLPRLPGFLADINPDVLSVQECGERMAAQLRGRTGWFMQRHGSLCLLSRWPFTHMDTMPRLAFQRVSALGYGGSGHVLRVRVAHPQRPFDLVNLHLETARKGLDQLLGSEGLLPDDGGLPDEMPFRPAGDRVEINARIRLMESERAAVWSARDADRVPLVVTGDFNLPTESEIYRRYWSDFGNAFEDAGTGFGYTKRQGTLLRIRIDHVLFAPKWLRAEGAWVGRALGSDHRPLIADLRWRE